MDFDDNFKGDRPREQFFSTASDASHSSTSQPKGKDIVDPTPIAELRVALMQQMTNIGGRTKTETLKDLNHSTFTLDETQSSVLFV